VGVEHEVGSHRMTVDGDWVEMRFVGVVNVADSSRLHALLAEVLANNAGRAHVLADITRLEGLLPEARRDMSEWNSKHKITAAAVFGGGFTVRTIVTLALKAIKLRDPNQFEVTFTRTEEEARRWLCERAGRRF
jgi:hypothetical protein